MDEGLSDLLPKENKSEGNTYIFVAAAINPDEKSNEEPDTVALKRIFKIALESRNFEIAQLVQRNNFFMIFQGVLLAGMIQSSHSKPVVSFLVCVVGLLVSFCQVQMAAGAKYWQEYWEAALKKIEKMLLDKLSSPDTGRSRIFQLFHDDDCVYQKMVGKRMKNKGFGFTSWLVMHRFSVSRVPIYVGIVFMIVWAILLLCSIRSYPPFSVPSFIQGF